MRRYLCVLALLAVLPPLTAQADGEGWLIGEGRLPIYQRPDGRHRLRLRMLTDFRVAGRSGGVQQALSRVGMTWDPVVSVMLAAQITMNASSNDGQKYNQELRQEFEVTVTTQPLRWLSQSHRQRLELRWSPGWLWARHRLLQRFSFGPPGWRVQPYVLDELFLDGREGIHQNRVVIGLSWLARRNLRIEAGYLWRLRKTSPQDFADDHALRVVFTFDPSFEGAARGQAAGD